MTSRRAPRAIEVSYTDFDDSWASQTALPNPAVQMLRKMSAPDIERLKASLRVAADRTRRAHQLSGISQRGTRPRGGASPELDFYCGLMPAALMIGHHFAISDLWKDARCSGVSSLRGVSS